MLSDDAPFDAAWAINTWFDAERITVRSIGDAANALRARQRNWACLLGDDHRGRAGLIIEKLPHVSARPLPRGQASLSAPLGSWTLSSRTELLAAASCTSPFPNGEPLFVDDRTGPPNRAYKKLWEALALLRRFPRPGERCLDLGASPGGWTWTLAQFGADVTGVDRAPLDTGVAALPHVSEVVANAFDVDPHTYGPVHWLCSDVVAYPERVVELIERWQGHAETVICNIKFQGATDHGAIDALRQLPNAAVRHLFHNKHEVTFVQSARGLGAFSSGLPITRP